MPPDPLIAIVLATMGGLFGHACGRAAGRLPAAIDAELDSLTTIRRLLAPIAPAERRAVGFWLWPVFGSVLLPMLAVIGLAPVDAAVIGAALLLLAALGSCDAGHFLLPDLLVLPFALLGLAALALGGAPTPLDALIGAVAGGGVLLGLRWAFLRWRGVDALGLGDVKLAAAGGVWIGWLAVPNLLFLAAMLSLAWGVGQAVLRGQGLRRDTAVPLGVGLTAALAGLFLWQRLTAAGLL